MKSLNLYKFVYKASGVKRLTTVNIYAESKDKAVRQLEPQISVGGKAYYFKGDG